MLACLQPVPKAIQKKGLKLNVHGAEAGRVQEGRELLKSSPGLLMAFGNRPSYTNLIFLN